jgi:hypothetical protein
MALTRSHLGNAFKSETNWWVDAVSMFLKTELWVYGSNGATELPSLLPSYLGDTADI